MVSLLPTMVGHMLLVYSKQYDDLVQAPSVPISSEDMQQPIIQVKGRLACIVR